MGLVLLCLSTYSWADELRPAYLQMTEIEQNVFAVLWKVPAKGEQRLALYVRFGERDIAREKTITGFLGGTYIQNWKVAFADGLTGQQIKIDGLSRTTTDVLLRIEYLDGASVTHRFTPAAPTYTVTEKPTFLQTAQSYFMLGVEHILKGVDHLLFVLALLLLIDNRHKLLITVTFFTIAHSITLSLATRKMIHVPVPPVEAVIALSIVFVAAEIIRARRGYDSLTYRKPWVVAFTFGLLHGVGFAAALQAVGLPENAVPLALVFFNIGVEAGQLLFISVVFGLLWIMGWIPGLTVHFGGTWRRAASLSTPAAYLIGSVAMFWVFERSYGFWP